MTAHAGGSEYGSVAAEVPPREVPPRRSWGGRTALVSAALLAGVCVGMLAASARLAGSSRAAVLAGLGDAGAQLDADAARVAVAHRVGHRFLGDAVGGQLDLRAVS